MQVRQNPALNSTSIMVNNVSRSGGPGGYNEDCSSGMMSSPSRFQHDLLLEHIDNEDEEHTRLRHPSNAMIDQNAGVLSPSNLILQGTAAPGAPS